MSMGETGKAEWERKSMYRIASLAVSGSRSSAFPVHVKRDYLLTPQFTVFCFPGKSHFSFVCLVP